MLIFAILTTSIVSMTTVSIVEPIDGNVYDGDWLPLRVIIENNNEIPDSVHYSLNGESTIQISRLNTDWYTYMRDNNRHGSTESPAPLTPEVMWTANVTGTYHEFVSPIVVNGLLYHASEDQETAFCLNAATGEIIWSFPNLGDPIDDALAYYEGCVFVASDSLWCLDALTGERIWAYIGHGDYYMLGPPVVTDDVVYAIETKSYDTFVTALNFSDGSFIWERNLPHKTASSPTCSDDFVLITTYLGPFYALARNDGSIVWENTDSEGGFWDTSPVVVGETVFAGGNDSFLHSFNIADGFLNWETEFGYKVECTPCYYDGKLYVGCGYSADRTVACVDAETGSIIWEAYGGLHSSMGYASGYCFWGDTSDNTVKCADASTGEIIWSYNTDLSISSPAIVDGVMFIGATDSCLYAFGTGFKYTYKEDYFYADVGFNELIATSFYSGEVVAADTISFTVTQSGISLEPSRLFSLSATPNPFQSSAAITFELNESGVVSLQVFDLAGRTITSLIDHHMAAGTHSVQWDGFSQNGKEVSAGLYLCRIESGRVIETTGLCILR